MFKQLTTGLAALLLTFAAWAADPPAAAASAPAEAASAPATAASAPDTAASAPSAAALDTRVQQLKAEVIRLNRDLLVLEEELLFPAGTQVAHVEALHATAVQRLHLGRGVEVGADDLVVQFDLHRFQLEHLAHVHRHEDGHLGAGREQQFFFQHQQVAVEADDLGLEFLDAGVERCLRCAGGTGGGGCGHGRFGRCRRIGGPYAAGQRGGGQGLNEDSSDGHGACSQKVPFAISCNTLALCW